LAILTQIPSDDAQAPHRTLKIGSRGLKLAAHIDPVRDGQPYRQAGALLEEVLPEIGGDYAISNGRTSPGALTIQGSRDANNIPNA
jgi:hypothetical protein